MDQKSFLFSPDYYLGGTLDFVSAAPALLFWFVCLLTSTRCSMWDTEECVCVYVNSGIKSKHYCSCRYPPPCIGHRIQTMGGWDGGVGKGWDGGSRGRAGRRIQREREWGGWAKHSIQVSMLFDEDKVKWSVKEKSITCSICPQKGLTTGSPTEGFIWDVGWIYCEAFQSFSQFQCYSGNNQVKGLINLSKMQSNLI